MKKLLSILCMTFIVGSLFSCGSRTTALNETNVSGTSIAETENLSNTTALNESNVSGGKEMGKNIVAEISVLDYGKIQVELYEDVAPKTVENFVKLVEQKFYDGLTFHRIITGFMIQGGDPLGNGTGGSDERIVGEFTNNGFENNLSHERGVISMARSMDPNSASSQFFICHADSPWLDKEYASFGKCISGLEVVDKICDTVKVEDKNGTVLAENQPKIEYIKIIN